MKLKLNRSNTAVFQKAKTIIGPKQIPTFKNKESKAKYHMHGQNSKMKDYDIAKVKERVKQAKKVEHLPLNASDKKPELPKWLEKHFGSSARKRLGVAASVGAAVGLLKSGMDKDNDDVLSTGEKIVKYSALGVGASYGGEIALGFMGITSKHYAHANVAKEAKKTMDAAEEMRWQQNMKRKSGVAMAVGIAAFGVATIADSFEGMEQERKASIERNRQEQELAQRQSAESRRQDKQGYGYVDYGQIVLQQYEKRIGHYAMGNAKFQ